MIYKYDPVPGGATRKLLPPIGGCPPFRRPGVDFWMSFARSQKHKKMGASQHLPKL